MTTRTRRMIALLIALVWASASAQAGGQEGDLWLHTARGEAFYRIVQDAATVDLYEAFRAQHELQGDDSIGAEVMRAVHAVLAADHPDDVVVAEAICAAVTGAGSRPRLDGGGPPLQTSDSPPGIVGWFPDAVHVAPSDLPTFGVLARTLVVIDEFDLDALLRAVESGPASGAAPTMWNVLYADHASAAGTDPEAYEAPHGHLVLYHLLRSVAGETVVLAGARRYLHHDGTEAADHLIVHAEVANETIDVHLLAIDFDDLDTIDAALVGLWRVDGDPVVVMSWGLVDCAVRDHYAREHAPVDAMDAPRSYAEFMHDVIAESDELAALAGRLCSAFAEAIGDAFGGDPSCNEELDVAALAPLLTVAALATSDQRAAEALRIAERDFSDALTFFASAGNQGLVFPMPPAAWPGISGVAACSARQPGLAPFSNAPGFAAAPHHENVVALGAWFVSPEVAPAGALGYWGTSFAAPHAAAAYAADGYGSFHPLVDAYWLSCDLP